MTPGRTVTAAKTVCVVLFTAGVLASGPYVRAQGAPAEAPDQPVTRTVVIVTAPPLAGKNAKPLAGYDEALIRSVAVAQNAQTAEYQESAGRLLEQTLIARLEKSKLFRSVRTADSAESETEDDNALEVTASIVGYRRGNRAQRVAAGLLGFGATSIAVRFDFRDAATGTPLFTTVKSGSASLGTLGGSAEETTKIAIDKTVDRALAEVKKKH